MKVTKHKGHTVYSNGLIEKRQGNGYIAPALTAKGYYRFGYYINGKRTPMYVHRFIWEAFNGPIPDGMTIDHIDNDRTNNRLDNLRLLTHAENCSRGQQRFTKAQLDEMRYLRSDLRWTLQRIADRFGVTKAAIRQREQKGFTYVY